IDGAFDLIARSGCAWRCGQGRPDGETWNQPRKIHMPPFTAALFRRDLFNRVGLLDERFESYLEDVDFGLRCASQGLGGVYAPDAVAYHEGSATLGEWNPDTVRRLSRNQVWLVAKHFRGDPLWPVLAGQLLWAFVAFRHGGAVAWCRGKWQGLHDFSKVRREGAGGERLPLGFLRESERGIWYLQNHTGFDLYWRIYFWLAPSGRGKAMDR
ncbi:MAG: glycosyltransferase family 2 protein, partial [Bryobacteraceae bacterium]